jgi:hypothetical protein
VGFEADILESVTGGARSNIFYSGYSTCEVGSVNNQASSSDTFHIWGMLWDAVGGLTFYRDGVQNWQFAGPVSTNLAAVIFVGTAYPGPSSTGLLVDWFRYYQPN